MFVFLGKLNWGHYAKEESFVIVLPNGPVRAGDTAYMFFQWTKNYQGAKKPNWFQNIAIEKVSKIPCGSDVFTLKQNYYSWHVTTKDNYAKLDVVMSNPKNEKIPQNLKRIWQPKDNLTSGGTMRIWTGKVNWPKYASNEMGIFIVPDGFGEGKPVLSLWQWTKNADCVQNFPSFRDMTQKIQPGFEGGVKFSFKDYYELNCNWDEKTEKLDVHMKGPEANQQLGVFTLSALVDRHSHDFNPPESSPQKAELEVRLPQVQDSLPRILTPMPFPRTLLETLTHTAAFVDQAGYLAKYAEERFKALDADFHVRCQELDAVKTQNKGLNDRVKQLSDDLGIEKTKTTDLEKRLADAKDDAKKQELDFDKKIKELTEKNDKHDKEDHKRIKQLEQFLTEARRVRDDLQKRLDEALSALSTSNAELQAAKSRNLELEADIAALEAKLSVERSHGEKLSGENAELKKKIDDLEAQLRELQQQLAKALEDLQRTQESLEEKKGDIRRMTKELADAANEREGLEKTIEELKRKREEAEKGRTEAGDKAKEAVAAIDRLRQERDEAIKERAAIDKKLDDTRKLRSDADREIARLREKLLKYEI
ncbi:hypothetical protein CSOJ01_11091 [Colletotrichum sojae]|uniref:Uncharacterized protein n=1 Tax=Colletotrichum sojae TaxID=2175907 RepID=A0A8H6MPB5_9PEZI|nr:hypothetical protein CSOJ01_11091 [Colletotrichum sojae]